MEQVTAAPPSPVDDTESPEKPAANPLDDPDNPNVPKGGRWGVTGMGQTPEMFRTRVGIPGLNKSPSGRVKGSEAQKLAKRIDQVEPDEVVAYSRGAALFNAAQQAGMKHQPAVTYMAPSSYRNWGNAPVSPAPAGSKVLIGDQDTLIPMKQAAKNAVDANAQMFVLPGFSHVGIMYSHGEVTPGGFEVDPEGILADPEMPDWGRGGSVPGSKGGPTLKNQAQQVKTHVKESQLRRMIRDALIENLIESGKFF